MIDQRADPAPEARRVHLYCRVSTAEQSREGYSLGEQERQCRAIAETYYSDREIVLWVEPGVSAGVPLGKRKTGSQMVAALRGGDVLIAAKLDRVFRSLIDALTQIEDFVAQEIACVLLDIGTEPISGTGAGKLQFQLLSAMGEFERTRMRERQADSRAARRAKGIPLSRNAPIGFAVEGEGKNKRLVPHPREQEMFAEMRRLRQEQYSFAAISREIAERGYRNRKGRIIDSAHIRLLLQRDQPQTQSNRSEHIKAAIARKREDGWIPGNPNLAEARKRGTAALMRLRVERYHRLEPIIRNLVKEGYTSYRTIAIMLNAAKVPTLGRAKKWYPASVRKVMQRLDLHSPHLPGRPCKPRNGAAPTTAAPGAQPPPTPLNTSLRRWRNKRNVKILALRDDGLSADQIADRLPLGDANTVRRVLRGAGLPLGLERAAAKADDILALRQAGRPVREIAEKIGLHARSIYRLLAQQRECAAKGDTACATDVLPVIWSLQATGIKRPAIAQELNRRQIPGPNNQPWTFNAVKKLMSQHRRPLGAVHEHKTAAEMAAVLPLIRQFQRDGHDAAAIASRLQGKFTGRIWSTAAVEAVLERASEALAALPPTVGTAAAPSDLVAPKQPSPLTLNERDGVPTSPRHYDQASLAEHVWPAIITLRAAGYKTAAAICRELNTRGVLAPDGTQWTTVDIRGLLQK